MSTAILVIFYMSDKYELMNKYRKRIEFTIWYTFLVPGADGCGETVNILLGFIIYNSGIFDGIVVRIPEVY